MNYNNGIPSGLIRIKARIRIGMVKSYYFRRTRGIQPGTQAKANNQTVKTAGLRNGRSPNEWQTVAAVPTKTATNGNGIQ